MGKIMYNGVAYGSAVPDTFEWVDYPATLLAGATTLTIQGSAIDTDKNIEIFTDIVGVNPTNAVASSGSITLTFEAQESNVGVKVRVSNSRNAIEILKGATEPASTQGNDGQIYLQYQSGADIFGKPSSNTPQGASISATSTYSSYSPYKAFGHQDGWGANGSNGTLTYEFTSDSFKPAYLSFVDYFDVSGGYLKANTFTFEGSNDGTNWDVLYSKTDEATTKDTVKTAVINTQTAYSKFRFVINGGSGYAGIKDVFCLEDGTGSNLIFNAFVKVNGAWQSLIGTDISYVST